MNIQGLADADRGYALSAWREEHHKVSKMSKLPWPVYKRWYGDALKKIMFDDINTLALGAYRDNELLGFLIATPGKRVDTLHWVQVKYRDKAGKSLRQQGIASALIEHAKLGKRFVYTLKAAKKLDEELVTKLEKRGVVAAYLPLMEWRQ